MELQKENFLKEIVQFTIIALLIVFGFRTYIAKPFYVSGASMEPTFESSQYLIVDQLSYRFEDPSRGDVIIFKFPQDESKYFIKRIIGLPGETVEIRGTAIIIKNEGYPDGFILTEPYIEKSLKRQDFLTTTLGSDEYFVMGDNRDASSDSRIWGSVKRELISGRAFLRLLPVGQTDFLPGSVDDTYPISNVQ